MDYVDALKTARDELRQAKAEIEDELAVVERLIAKRERRPLAAAGVESLPAQATSPDKKAVRTGLRDALRQALADAFPRGAKPAAVTAHLEKKQSFDTDGAKTDLGTRVRNELWRMADRGELERDAKGRYRLPAATKEGEAESVTAPE